MAAFTVKTPKPYVTRSLPSLKLNRVECSRTEYPETRLATNFTVSKTVSHFNQGPCPCLNAMHFLRFIVFKYNRNITSYYESSNEELRIIKVIVKTRFVRSCFSKPITLMSNSGKQRAIHSLVAGHHKRAPTYTADHQ